MKYNNYLYSVFSGAALGAALVGFTYAYFPLLFGAAGGITLINASRRRHATKSNPCAYILGTFLAAAMGFGAMETVVAQDKDVSENYKEKNGCIGKMINEDAHVCEKLYYKSLYITPHV